ncbi:Threonylcarbamoyladenosine tRNA methylthiotransferase, partial [Microtus ochrogaster]
IGERQQVLVTEESFDSKFYVAHNRFYEQVLVPKNPEFMGKMVEVDIYESGKHFLKGRPVSNTKIYTPSISKPLAKGEVSGLTKEFRNRFGNHPKPTSDSCAPTRRDSAYSRIGLRMSQRDSAVRVAAGLALIALLFAFLAKVYAYNSVGEEQNDLALASPSPPLEGDRFQVLSPLQLTSLSPRQLEIASVQRHPP